MTRIITHNNTRYRPMKLIHPGETFPDCGQDAWLVGDKVVGKHHFETEEETNHGGEVWSLHALPFIPDWPGYRPEQYLANSRDQPDCPIEKGDLLLFQSPSDWTFIVRETDEPTTLGFLAGVTNADSAYLISRANPEHDAEDTT